MKNIEITMSSGPAIIVPFEKAEKLLNSKDQLLKIVGPDGNWTGESINKAHIVSTTPTEKATTLHKFLHENRPTLPFVPAPIPTPEQQAKTWEKLREIRKGLEEKGIVQPKPQNL